jgi:hypothetical protein
MDNIEAFVPGEVYFVNHNGQPDFGYLQDYDGQVFAYDTARVWPLLGWEMTQKGDTTTFSRGDSFYSVRPVQLDDTKTVFPTLIRTFRDVPSLQQFVKKMIAQDNTYTVNTDPDETISFTIDDDGTVLELIRVTDEGEMYARDNGGWVRLQGEDHPTIVDKDLVDVGPDDIPEAIKTWDAANTAGSTLMESDILPMASAQQ